uniref:Uncharacterized protein n=1 Tax=Salix viminalis TaxID=40686 RepID=A0A6N2M798_SALVM
MSCCIDELVTPGKKIADKADLTT